MILTALEIPNLWRAREAANQAAAAASLRAIETAETVYAATYGGTYSASLSQLGPPPADTQASPSAAGLVDKLLASATKGGYQFIYLPGPLKDGKIDSFSAEAAPEAPCVTGSMSFTVDSSSGVAVTSQSLPNNIQSDPVTQTLGNALGGSSTCGGP